MNIDLKQFISIHPAHLSGSELLYFGVKYYFDNGSIILRKDEQANKMVRIGYEMNGLEITVDKYPESPISGRKFVLTIGYMEQGKEIENYVKLH